VYRDKRLLLAQMGVYQRLFGRNDGLPVDNF
jgi:hypothetical protein